MDSFANAGYQETMASVWAPTGATSMFPMTIDLVIDLHGEFAGNGEGDVGDLHG